MLHKPVLLKEVVGYLNLKLGDTVLDATINGGGHAEKIVERIGNDGTLIGIDQDAVILEKLKLKIKNLKFKDNVVLINGNFRDLDKLLELLKIKKINGALFDLGMSSIQLEDSGRGFTFMKDEPLLMTYKSEIASSDLTARDILNQWSEEDLTQILFKYGEERYARKIARAIIKKRKKKKIETTTELKEIIEKNVPPSYRHKKGISPVTKTFQALRITVNDELNALKEGVGKVWKIMKPGSRLVVISFHSLEDRIIKNFFKDKKNNGGGIILTKKPIVPSSEEIKINPKSRSAKLRAIEKIK
ncbi:MAG: 16S rRNA (cytosine(1402)-N(4))-methyltransferase RsmH [Patescibacteria group bacterium]